MGIASKAESQVSVVKYFNPKLRAQIRSGATPRWLLDHPRRMYIVAANLATPDWVDRAVLKKLHADARRLSRVTGVEHVLDHEVPLSHPYVCGLTVPWNLRIVTRAHNAAKSNKWHPDQLELDLCLKPQPTTTLCWESRQRNWRF
jgi:hypothetical protein